MFNKRGVSSIVIIILVILLSTGATAIVWKVISPLVQGDNIQKAQVCLKPVIEAISCQKANVDGKLGYNIAYQKFSMSKPINSIQEIKAIIELEDESTITEEGETSGVAGGDAKSVFIETDKKAKKASVHSSFTIDNSKSSCLSMYIECNNELSLSPDESSESINNEDNSGEENPIEEPPTEEIPEEEPPIITDPSPSGNEPRCGNGIMEYPEECDLEALAGKTCMDFGFTSGELKCKIDCKFDKSECSSMKCTDSDNEDPSNIDPDDNRLNYYLKGSAVEKGQGYIVYWTDKCLLKKKTGTYSYEYNEVVECSGKDCFMQEGYCTSEDKVSNLPFLCAKTEVCRDGACVNP